MKIDIFFDTNILYYDYKIKNRKLKDLVEWLEDEKIDYSLCITKMTYHELLVHYEKNFKNALEEMEKFNDKFSRDFSALFNNFRDLNSMLYDTQIFKEQLVPLKKEYEETLKEKFEIIAPTATAHKKVFERYYENLSPFKQGMKEFKDALIWETISEHIELIDTPAQVWFVSSDESAFYSKIEDGLDKDFKHDGDIYFYKDLIQLLQEKEIIINNLLPENIEGIFEEFVSNMNKKKEDYYIVEEYITGYLENYISTNHFDGEYGDGGWGTDLYIHNIEISELHYEDGYKSLSHIDLPVTVIVDFEFNIETINPVYERGDTDFEQHINIGEMTETADLYFVLTYDVASETIVEIGDVEFH